MAYRSGIPVVLPLALGEWSRVKGWGVIVYLFLQDAVTLESVYSSRSLEIMGFKYRLRLEERVGTLMRKLSDMGAYPVDAHLDHFLVVNDSISGPVVYYVDLERMKFNSWTRHVMGQAKRIKTLGRLLARLEWLARSGGGVSRSAMMRMGRFFFRIEKPGPLDKRLCRRVIRAARRYWDRRKFQERGRSPLRSIQVASEWDSEKL